MSPNLIVPATVRPVWVKESPLHRCTLKRYREKYQNMERGNKKCFMYEIINISSSIGLSLQISYVILLTHLKLHYFFNKVQCYQKQPYNIQTTQRVILLLYLNLSTFTARY